MEKMKPSINTKQVESCLLKSNIQEFQREGPKNLQFCPNFDDANECFLE
jgi:hypothetical protein